MATNVYVDSSATGANDGTTMANAFTSLSSVTWANDTLVWVRRTHAETIAAQITISGPTSVATPCALIGWPISGDLYYAGRPSDTASWDSDSTASKPTLTSQVTSTTGLLFVQSDLAGIYRIKMVADAATAVVRFIYWNHDNRTEVRDCEFDLSATTATTNLYTNQVANSHIVGFKDCAFVNNGSGTGTYTVYSTSSGKMWLTDCTVDYGQRGVYHNGSGVCVMTNVVFGGVSAPTASDVLTNNAEALLIGCTRSSAALHTNTAACVIRSLHEDATLDAYEAVSFYSTISKTEAVTRSGGGAFSMILTPTSSTLNSLYSLDDSPFTPLMEGYPSVDSTLAPIDGWSVYNDGSAVTISVYVYTRNWTTRPTAKQLYLRASYISNATTGAQTVAVSTESVAANDTWTELSVTITPAAAGMVFLSLPLHVYESGTPTRDVLIDPLPVVS